MSTRLTRLLPLAVALSLLGCNRADALMDSDGTQGQGAVQTNNTDGVRSKGGAQGNPLTEVKLPKDQAGLVAALGDITTADGALEKLVAIGPGAVPSLRQTAQEGTDITARGWAIEGLVRMAHPDADEALRLIQNDNDAPELVRAWAAAGRINRCQDMEELMLLLPEVQRYPAVNRPIQLRTQALLGTASEAGPLLKLLTTQPNMQAQLAPIIMGMSVESLMDAMLHDDDTNVRRMAASYVATKGSQDGAVAGQVAKAYAYTVGADQVLWHGGALYVPSLGWKQKQARQLIGNLVSWHLFCDRMKLESEKQQLYNNLRSVSLLGAGGYNRSIPTDTVGMLTAYKNVEGRAALEKMLSEQGELENPRYAPALK